MALLLRLSRHGSFTDERALVSVSLNVLSIEFTLVLYKSVSGFEIFLKNPGSPHGVVIRGK